MEGGTPELIERWKRAAEREPDEGRRRLFRDAALILAELTSCQVNWFHGTKEWLMRESTLINSWIREGEERGELNARRALLLKRARHLEDPVPESIRLAIEGTTDLEKLEQWIAAHGTPQQVALRCRIVVLAAGGKSDLAIAKQLSTQGTELGRKIATVSLAATPLSVRWPASLPVRSSSAA